MKEIEEAVNKAKKLHSSIRNMASSCRQLKSDYPYFTRKQWIEVLKKAFEITETHASTYHQNYIKSGDGEKGAGIVYTNVNNGDNATDTHVKVIASCFVDYFREKPYRTLETRRGSGDQQPIFSWFPSNGVICGWNERLENYKWGNKGWNATCELIGEFEEELRELKKTCKGNDKDLETYNRKAKNIYEKIKKWGNPAGASLEGCQIADYLEKLWNGKIEAVDSTLTKLYAFARPDQYVIYDSRVAASILTTAEDIYRVKQNENNPVDTAETVFRSIFKNIGVINEGRGGTRPRGTRLKNWPNAYRNIEAQIDANRLCCSIRDCLNEKKENNRQNWTLREVEAVFFMDGY